MHRDEALQVSNEALQDLAAQLRQGKSEQLVRYLNMLTMFHSYSFSNLMLITQQKPAATMVAGFQRWKQLGRFVKKSEKGIAILAPLVRKRRTEAVDAPAESDSATESQQPNADQSKVLYGFRVVHVFDVSQTEGDKLPEFAAVQGDPGHKLNLLLELITSQGIKLEFQPQLPCGALGMSTGGTIVIAASQTPAQMFATLAHEFAHEQLHWGDRRKSTTKLVRETEAEAVAYVVCRAMGLECLTQSSDYIQLYSGDDKILLQSLEMIRSVAARMIEQLTALDTAHQRQAEVA